MFWAGWWIMIIIKHNNNDNINNNSETGGCVFSSLKKNNFICKYQRILSGITNHLHDHEEFLSLTSVITSRWAVLSSATCTNTHTHLQTHIHTHTQVQTPHRLWIYCKSYQSITYQTHPHRHPHRRHRDSHHSWNKRDQVVSICYWLVMYQLPVGLEFGLFV